MYLLVEDAGEVGNGNTALLHRVAVTDGNGVVLKSLMVDSDTVRRTDCILTAVAFADRVLAVVLHLEIKLQKSMIS